MARAPTAATTAAASRTRTSRRTPAATRSGSCRRVSGLGSRNGPLFARQPARGRGLTAAGGRFQRRDGGVVLKSVAVVDAPVRADTPGEDVPQTEPPLNAPKSTTIVGGGPTGLATAIMLAQMGYQCIQVLERLEEPPHPDSDDWGNPDRSYNLGINGRGQKSLKELGCYDRIEARCGNAMGRLSFKPDGTMTETLASQTKSYTTKLLQRDRLVACLLEEIREKYPDQVTVRHGMEVHSVEWLEGGSGVPPAVRLEVAETTRGVNPEDTEAIVADFLVGADGFRSTVPAAIEGEEGSKVRRKIYEDSNPRVYKTIALSPPKGWRTDMNYSASSAVNASQGHPDNITFEALPTKEGMVVGLLLFKPGNKYIENITTTAEARAMFAEHFPQFVSHVSTEEYRKFAEKPVSRLPVFQYCGPDLHRGTNTVLVGDCIHTVKPYFGQGVNSAFEDVVELKKCLEDADHQTAEALPNYSRSHSANAKSLVTMSRSFDVGGFLFFVLPLILDGIFNKIAPWLFTPNSLRMLQRADLSFNAIRRRKLVDRILQIFTIGAVLAGLVRLAVMGFRSGARFLATGTV